MKRITLIHTVKSVCDNFEPMLRAAANEELLIHNILDDYLSSDPDEKGYVSEVCKKRLYNHILSAQLAQSDLIVVTCSAMSATVKVLRQMFETPLVAIDEQMILAAINSGPRITVMATARSSAITTSESIQTLADAMQIPVTITALENQVAFDALQSGDKEIHDRLVKEQAATLEQTDVVVLAQASMAHLEQDVSEITAVPVLTSPTTCIRQICDMLAKQ